MDHLFTIWLTDNDWDGMPYLWEICIASAQVFSGKKVTIYTNHKLHLSFLDRKITEVIPIDNELMEMAESIDPNSKAHQSDYIRLKLLEKYGGCYFDTDILFYKNFDELWNNLVTSGKQILYLKEDKYMFTNCFMMCNDPDNKAKQFFENMYKEYETRFIRHSYLHNSQKIIDLMYRRYDVIMEYTDESFFNVPWNYSKNVKEFWAGVCPGYGQHLFSSNKEWNEARFKLNQDCYELETQDFPLIVTRTVIDKYIDLMKEADTSDTK